MGLTIIALGAIGLAWWGTARPVAIKGTGEQFLAWNGHQSGVVTTKSGLQYKIIEKGEGDTHPTDADMVAVGYRGTLQNGTVFDENPQASFPVKGVVPGFSEAVKLMRRKSHYRFWIPSALGYGAQPPQGAPIPPNALLIFDVKLEDFRSEAEVQAMQQMMQQMQGAKGAGGAGAPSPEGAGAPPPEGAPGQ
ncbi:MAG: hypothetical protein RIS52_2022 [Pseudomonadota bacterium]|jgi:hypothetical protein